MQDTIASEEIFDSKLHKYDGMLCYNDKLSMMYMHAQMVDEFLLMKDHFSMQNGLEVRTPYLRHKLVEFAFSIPEHIKYNSDDAKHFLKQTLNDVIPKKILYSPKKGFSVPISKYMRTILRDRIDCIKENEYLDRDHTKKVIENMFAGNNRYLEFCWSVLMFDLFLDEIR